MKANFFVLIILIILGSPAFAQRNCGQAIMIQVLEAKHPGATELIAKSRVESIAVNASNPTSSRTLFKTTASAAFIPVVFHLVIDSNTFKQLGGEVGIMARINSQMKVINDDFNGANIDKVKIPSVWASLYANVGIEFGLARIAPDGGPTLGYTIKIVPDGKSFDVSDAAKDMKFAASGGTDNWDNTKYLNIWVGNIKYGGSNILGVTVPPGLPLFTKPEYGIALNQFAFGVRTSFSQPFITNIDKGRTLTHELGHYFQLIHTWGDDGGLCFGSGGIDDGMSDTPVEGDATYGDPTFPRFDVCTPSGNGIMFMNYMDYTNDASMYMFTQRQALRMNAEVSLGGNSYSLTLNKHLSDTQLKAPIDIKLYPNPTTGLLTLQYDFISNPLMQLVVYNLLGQKVIEITNQNINAIDMRTLSKGCYFVHCIFEKQTIKQKIILQ
jgi:hypothetical protein